MADVLAWIVSHWWLPWVVVGAVAVVSWVVKVKFAARSRGRE